MLALIVASTPALADTVPRYDPAGYCKEVGDAVGGSSSIEKSCIELEQQAYNELKAGWASYPARARSYCDEVSQATGGTYQILLSCIEKESEAESEKPDFQF